MGLKARQGFLSKRKRWVCLHASGLSGVDTLLRNLSPYLHHTALPALTPTHPTCHTPTKSHVYSHTHTGTCTHSHTHIHTIIHTCTYIHMLTHPTHSLRPSSQDR